MIKRTAQQYWLHGSLVESKISLAVLAYAAGDAFGVQFEFRPKIVGDIEHRLAPIEGWPTGGVSDDTLLSILTIQALFSPKPSDGHQKFLQLLHDSLPNLRGLGPTTRSALGLPVKESERHQVGFSNGGMMRTALLGLAFSFSSHEERRDWVIALASATHTFPTALDCSQILAAGFSAAAENDEIQAVIAAIKAESESNSRITADTKSAIALSEIWMPRDEGVSNDSLETLLAVIFVVTRATSTRDAYSIACSLGGDTDTVAALSGALYAATYCDSSNFSISSGLTMSIGMESPDLIRQCQPW